ncbi:hypothetical protein CISG_05053 [Coccidioides immitis RMSCC 3703]|uniref:Uncharacterized protein n=1 Tax=Coccidioides immitis RMSCC 3703 TaxID=454286 RepID=A0A0J8QVR9_COCIT|nr:hypothetical protein CISG_05053 [Coccidioides immitis RMSCC 3703]
MAEGGWHSTNRGDREEVGQICGAGAKSFEVQNLAVKHQNPQKERNHARMSINSLKYNRPGRKKSVKSAGEGAVGGLVGVSHGDVTFERYADAHADWRNIVACSVS